MEEMTSYRYSRYNMTLVHKKKAHSRKEWRVSPGLRGRLWIDGPEGTFLGYGRIVLLERIREHGSITGAANSMEMSYRHAWELVDSMNRQAESPLVVSATGGRGGGGTRLTESGEMAIRLFWRLHEDFQHFLKREEEILKLKSFLKKTKSRPGR